MEFTPRDCGYTVYSRYEQSLRFWIKHKLLTLYGECWKDQTPPGVLNKIIRQASAEDC